MNHCCRRGGRNNSTFLLTILEALERPLPGSCSVSSRGLSSGCGAGERAGFGVSRPHADTGLPRSPILLTSSDPDHLPRLPPGRPVRAASPGEGGDGFSTGALGFVQSSNQTELLPMLTRVSTPGGVCFGISCIEHGHCVLDLLMIMNLLVAEVTRSYKQCQERLEYIEGSSLNLRNYKVLSLLFP